MVATCRARASPFCVDVRDIANRPLACQPSEEEELLLSSMSADEQEAKTVRMILGNMYLQPIVTMAFRFDGLGLALCELTSAGIMGLNQAIQNHYDNQRSFRLHVFQYIQQAMINALMGVDQKG